MPDRNFNGCWHCGEQGHSRTKGRGKDARPSCAEFKALLEANNGKLPKDYEGTYEPWAKQTGKTLPKQHLEAFKETDQPSPSAQSANPESASGKDEGFPELSQLKALLQFGLFKKPAVSTKNSFEAVAPNEHEACDDLESEFAALDDQDNAEELILDALKAMP